MDRADVADVNGNANTTEVLRFHYHSQALGSVTEISQPTGAVVEWVTYDVYGAATIRDRLGATVASSAVGNPWLFTGRRVRCWVGARFPWTSDWGSHPVGESHGNQEEDHARNEAKA